ncbi:MAG: hypothetical protein WDO17_04065 [Alphaproteobacteria bacterium]
MSPNNNNNTGGSDRAALALRGEAARAGEMQVLANGFAMLALTIAMLVASAPELWPQLFAQ